MSRVGLIIAVSVALCAGLTLALFPFIDLWVAKTLSDSALASSPIVPIVRDVGLWIELLFIAFPFIALTIKLLFPRSRMLMSGRAVVFLIATLALGPGLLVNVALKDNWGRPRPGHLKQFGGDQDFVPWWDPTGQCEKNCSFVSGESSAAFLDNGTCRAHAAGMASAGIHRGDRFWRYHLSIAHHYGRAFPV
jgi:lipid A 4'-phosphatase